VNRNLRLIAACIVAIAIARFAFGRGAPRAPLDADVRSAGASGGATAVPVGYATPVACDDAAFVRLEATQPRGYTEVTVCGTVTAVLPEKSTRSGLHRYFYVRPGVAADPIEIVTNVDETGEFTVNAGDTATVHGRYYDDSDATRGIDWTHHNGPNASWPYPGYVQIDNGPLIQ
jgi:hypothetical protein